MEEIVTIELLGEVFKFKAEPGVANADQIAVYLAGEVAKVEKQLSGKSPEISKLALLVLASLNISKELFELRHRHKDLLTRISERSERLINSIDGVM